MSKNKADIISGVIGGVLAGAVCLAGIAAVRSDAKNAAEKQKEKQRRMNTPCEFEDGITYEDFKLFVESVVKRIKRINSHIIDGPRIVCTVTSQSGISDWEFTVDFNDYGHLTGKYWIYSENDDSQIPASIATKVSQYIESQDL